MDDPAQIDNDIAVLAQYAAGDKLPGEEWDKVEKCARSLADILREDTHRTRLGTSSAVHSIAVLLRLADSDPHATLASQQQLARVVANLCVDHETNRLQCLKETIPEQLVSTLSKHIALHNHVEVPGQLHEWTSPDLDALKAFLGAIINLTMDCTPTQNALIANDIFTPLVMLVDPAPKNHVRTAVYSPTTHYSHAELEQRQLVVLWALRIIKDLLEQTEDPAQSLPTACAIRFINRILVARSSNTDLRILRRSSEILELATSESAPVQREIGILPFDDDTSVLAILLNFLDLFSFEEGSSSPTETDSDDEPIKVTSVLSQSKACIGRTIVASVSEEGVATHLFSNEDETIQQLITWLNRHERPDLQIVAATALANIARSEENCVKLLSSNYNILEPICKLLHVRAQPKASQTQQGETAQILYGLMGLLKHLSMPKQNKTVLAKSETSIIYDCISCLRQEFDVVEPVQVAAIGVVKHLVSGNLENAVKLAADAPSVNQITSLISRSSSTRILSEATRILSHTIRSLFATVMRATSEATSSPVSRNTSDPGVEITSAFDHLSFGPTLNSAKANIRNNDKVLESLDDMIRLSGKYPTLVNEGVVALTLVASSDASSSEKTRTLLCRQHSSSSAAPFKSISPTSPGSHRPPSRKSTLNSPLPPLTTLSVLTSWLQDYLAGSKPPELAGNVCCLLEAAQLGKSQSDDDEDDMRELHKALNQIADLPSTSEVVEAVKETASRVLAQASSE